MSFLTKTQINHDGAFDELQVLDSARKGDVRAFEKLYRSTAGRIYALCLRMCKDSDLAGELTQMSYIKAWKNLSSFRGESSFLTWLHRLAVNVVLTELRSRKRLTFFNEQLDNPDMLPDTDQPHPLKDDIERCLAALPDNSRVILVLHDIEGYQHHEIAEMTGLTVAGSKSRLLRARNALKELFTS